MLLILTFISPAQTSLQHSTLIYSTTYQISPLGYLIGNSDLKCPELLSTPLKTAFPNLSHNNSKSILSVAQALCTLQLPLILVFFLQLKKKFHQHIRFTLPSKDIHNPIHSYYLYCYYFSGRHYCNSFLAGVLCFLSCSSSCSQNLFST